jgi:hypothetical protein
MAMEARAELADITSFGYLADRRVARRASEATPS